MRTFLSRRRYEVLAVLAFGILASLHLATSRPLVGFDAEAGPVHRFIQTFESRMSTVFFRLRGERDAHPDVLVLEFDEKGAQRFGLWPWPRDQIAKGLENLLDADAGVIGLDITFSDETQVNQLEKGWLAALSSVPTLPEALAPLKIELEKRVQTSPDEALERVFRKAGPRIVQGLIPYTPGEISSIAAPRRAAWAVAAAPTAMTSAPGPTRNSVVTFKLDELSAYPYQGVQMPLARFAATGTAFGHFGAVPDIDSTIRRTPLLVKLEEPRGLFPSLALATVARALGAKIEPFVDDGALKGVRLKGEARSVFVPIQADGFTLINYPGSHNAFKRLSFVDAVDGTFDRAAVAGKVILAGVTIMGSSGDQRVTPFSEFEAGVYGHASLVSNALQGDFLDRPEWLVWVELAAMLLLGLLLAVVTPRVPSFLWKMAVIVAVVGGFTLVTLGLFSSGLKLNWVVPTLHLTVTAFGTIFLGYLSVDREKLKMRSTFSRYLGADVMDVALENPDRLNRGEKREMTVLFSDIRGFTSLSEHMSPEKLADFINQYLSPMTQIVFDEKGTLDKYIGDAVMAFWNAPLDQPDHALRACRAAVHMLERLEVLKAQWRAAGLPELEIGIGINTGQMVVGNMGSDVRVDYTVLGDSVNLASRLEGSNKEYETRIIISEWTHAAVKDGLVTRRLGAVRVKGKKVPVGIFELRGLGAPSAVDARAIAAFERGLVAMTERRFEDAAGLFGEVLALWPDDPPTRNYLAELEVFRASPPPPDWDGVVSLKTK